MALLRLRRERSSRAGTIAALSLGGLATGAALLYFLDPRRGEARRRRAGEIVREAQSRAAAGARSAGDRAGRAMRGARDKAEERIDRATERAEGAAEAAAEKVRATAASSHDALARRGVRDEQALQGAAVGVLLARAIFGGGVMRIPAGLIGLSIFSRLASRSSTLHRGVQRTREAAHLAAAHLAAAHLAADRLRERGGAKEEGAGGARAGERGTSEGGGATKERAPEVREVKSPAELEPGVATGVPEPTYRDRADRSGPHMGGRGGSGGYRASAAELGEDGGFLAPTTDDVERTSEFDAPEAGRSVREDELGMMVPRDDAEEAARRMQDEEEEQGQPLIVEPGEAEPNPRARIVAPHEVDANPDARLVDPEERPVGSGRSPDEETPPRRPGAAPRREPTDDGG